MCLLVQQPKSTIFTDDFLSDVYTKNRDGFGIMYAEDGKLHVFKCLPANAQDFIDFYRKHAEGRDCVWHARMQTHGDIDFDNCHPYKVTDDIWLAHNGVLSAGNDSDTKRSDTWHFIQYVLRPALEGNPGLINDENFQAYLGSLIGSSNKFGLVSSNGDTVIINRKSGVEFVGAWLSNTYAWSPSKFGFRPPQEAWRKYYPSSFDYDSGWSSGYDRRGSTYTDIGGGYTDMFTSQGRSTSLTHWKDAEKEEEETIRTARGSYVREPLSAHQIRPYIRAAFNQWMRRGEAGIEQWIKDAPHKAAAVLSFYYDDVDEIETIVDKDPEEAAIWISDLFRTDSVSPSMIDG